MVHHIRQAGKLETIQRFGTSDAEAGDSTISGAGRVSALSGGVRIKRDDDQRPHARFFAVDLPGLGRTDREEVGGRLGVGLRGGDPPAAILIDFVTNLPSVRMMQSATGFRPAATHRPASRISERTLSANRKRCSARMPWP